MAEQDTVGTDFSLAGVNFFVAGDLNAAGSAGGFTLSREDMTTELENLRLLRDRVREQRRAAAPMWSIASPGQDPASLRNTKASNNSGNCYGDYLDRQSRFLDTIIGKMQTALGITTQHDEQAGVDIGKVGGGHF